MITFLVPISKPYHKILLQHGIQVANETINTNGPLLLQLRLFREERYSIADLVKKFSQYSDTLIIKLKFELENNLYEYLGIEVEDFKRYLILL